MTPASPDELDHAAMTKASIRALGRFTAHFVLELAVFALVCFLGTAIVLFVLDR